MLVVLEPAMLEELAGYAESADAHIRENLAQAYGRLGGLGEIDTLVRLLSDRVWWVRYRAAQALLKLKGMDSARLDAIRAGLEDPYARDMLAQARAEATLS
jgi:HEAT repeat protein